VLATLSAIILPILIVSALGFVWGRIGHQLEPRLVTAIGTPSSTAVNRRKSLESLWFQQ